MFWAQSFINELNKKTTLKKIMGQSNKSSSLSPPKLNHDAMLSLYKNTRQRLVLFDYDGTLAPICKTPEDAVPSQDMLNALTAIVDDPRNLVFVISGRDQACLDAWLGHISGLGLRFSCFLISSAEHGCFVKYPNEKWKNIGKIIDTSTWKPTAQEIFTRYTEQTKGSFIEYKKSSITWHYRHVFL